MLSPRLFTRNTITAVAISFFTAILLLSAGCSGKSHGSPAASAAIGLQPIGDVDTLQLVFIRAELSRFFGRPVIILHKIAMPSSFLNSTKGERYSADSIIKFLSHRTNDSLPQLVGITGKDIYTTMRDAKGAIKKPRYKYEVWGIMGLGYCPGKACVVSAFRLRTTDPEKFRHRLRSIVFHEVGHNFGLPHCPHARCIMNEGNGSKASVDSCDGNYCASCRDKLKAAGNAVRAPILTH